MNNQFVSLISENLQLAHGFGVSEKVGDILAEMALLKINPPSNYRYYM